MNNTTCDYCEDTGEVFSVNRHRWELCPYGCPDTARVDAETDRAISAMEDRNWDMTERMEERV